MLDIPFYMQKLAAWRPVFYSEKDFQLSLAWVIKSECSGAEVYLEYVPSSDLSLHVDIIVKHSGKLYPIEIKYKTKKCTIVSDGLNYSLKEHSAKDINSYAYLKDIERIEKLVYNDPDKYEQGYAIMLTNALTYKITPKDGTIYKAFSIAENEEKKGTMEWNAKASAGTKKGKEDPINIKGTYRIHWNDYSHIDDSKAGTFIWTYVVVKSN